MDRKPVYPEYRDSLHVMPAVFAPAASLHIGNNQGIIRGHNTYSIDALSRSFIIRPMARLARVVAAGVPHHVTQRGNRRQKVFFGDDDYEEYRTLLAEGCRAAGVELWGYCLMPNHVHLILVPPSEDGLRAALGEAHRRYTRHINFRKGWRGYLWQGRFASFPMDQQYLLACARYVELNPVRAKLTRRAQDWRWSSARAHLGLAADELVDTEALGALVPDWKSFLGEGLGGKELDAIRAGERTGRPLGSKKFIEKLERRLGRTLLPQKAGRKPAKAGKRAA